MENLHNSSVAQGHLNTCSGTEYSVTSNSKTWRFLSLPFHLFGAILASLLLFSCNSDDEPIIERDIIIRSQADIDALADKGVRRINGNLSIGKPNESSLLEDLTSLKGLASLEEISGNFTIWSAFQLESLEGLENLKRIGGNLSVFGNRKLETLSELSQLEEINGKLAIVGNHSLTDLAALDDLSGVQHLDIRNNDNLESLFDMRNIPSLDEVFIASNNTLAGITELTNTNISALRIRNNISLTSLRGLESTTSLRTFELWTQEQITGLEGLENLTSITDSLILRYNDKLVDLNAMGELEQGPYWMEVINNDKLESIDRFRMREDAEPVMAAIMGNWELRGVEPLQGLETVRGINIVSTNNLEDLSDLASLKEAEYVEIGAIALLQDLQGLEQLRSVEYLLISSNPNLSNIDALRGLSQVDTKLSLRWNSSLTDLCGIRPLVSSGGVGTDYEVYENAFNPSLEDINAGNCQN